jgi:dinuclear metal center YbgI/SA1388 family protein
VTRATIADPSVPVDPSVTVDDVIRLLDWHYPPETAEDWDRVGLVVGDPAEPVRTVLFVVDCVPETVAEAVEVGADLIVAHHPLLLRGVHSVATTTYKGRIVHDLIRNRIALFVAHTNADIARYGVAEALADRLGLIDRRPLRPYAGGRGTAPDPEIGLGRIGRLPQPVPLAAFAETVAGVLPGTAVGIRAAGPADRMISTVALCPGAGDSLLATAQAAGVDVYVTADLRHHPASEHIAAGGPALVDGAHWATERPWLDDVARIVADGTGVHIVVSDRQTDPWTVHAAGTRSVGAGES